MAVHKKYDRNVLGRGLDNIGDGKGRGLDALIAGERRWRAAKTAGMATIPAYIRTVEDEGVMEMALVENIQREDLNAIEIALAYQHMADTIGMTQERISERVGKSRTSVTNFMRLLKLPAQIQMALKNHEIDMGHARALLSIDSPSAQIKLFKDIQKNNYSVRKVEELVKIVKDGADLQTAKKAADQKARLPEEFNALRKRLAISIGFDNPDELEHIMNTFDKISN